MKATIYFDDRHGELFLTDRATRRPARTFTGRRPEPGEFDGRPAVIFMGHISGPEDPIPIPGSDEAPSARLLIEMWVRGDFAYDPNFFEVGPEARELAEQFLRRDWPPRAGGK